jgi:hypothetical protein
VTVLLAKPLVILALELRQAILQAQVPPGNSLAVYRESELRLLPGKTPEQVKAIHLAKQTLDGEVVDQPPALGGGETLLE